jgi:hypothetical protein
MVAWFVSSENFVISHKFGLKETRCLLLALSMCFWFTNTIQRYYNHFVLLVAHSLASLPPLYLIMLQ